MRSGGIHLTDKLTFNYANVNGRYWAQLANKFTATTDTSGNSTGATYLLLNLTDSRPTGGPNNRWLGWSLRCLSTAVEGEESRILKTSLTSKRCKNYNTKLAKFLQNTNKTINTIDKNNNLCYNERIGYFPGNLRGQQRPLF